MLKVEEWAEIRRLDKIEGLSKQAIGRKLGLNRRTVAEADGVMGVSQREQETQSSPGKSRATQAVPPLSGASLPVMHVSKLSRLHPSIGAWQSIRARNHKLLG
jgi:hypothetical protein